MKTGLAKPKTFLIEFARLIGGRLNSGDRPLGKVAVTPHSAKDALAVMAMPAGAPSAVDEPRFTLRLAEPYDDSYYTSARGCYMIDFANPSESVQRAFKECPLPYWYTNSKSLSAGLHEKGMRTTSFRVYLADPEQPEVLDAYIAPNISKERQAEYVMQMLEMKRALEIDSDRPKASGITMVTMLMAFMIRHGEMNNWEEAAQSLVDADWGVTQEEAMGFIEKGVQYFDRKRQAEARIASHADEGRVY